MALLPELFHLSPFTFVYEYRLTLFVLDLSINNFKENLPKKTFKVTNFVGPILRPGK